MLRLLNALGLGLVLSLLLAACQPAPATSPPTPTTRVVHFMAGYKPQANLPFVAAYLAQANGYFAEQGLSVEITHATGQGEQLKLLLQGSIDVTTDSADEVLAHRSEGLPVAAMAVLGQRDQRAFAVLASSPIQTPHDWEGRTVGYKVEPSPDYLALLAATGVDRSKLQEVPVGFDPRLLGPARSTCTPSLSRTSRIRSTAWGRRCVCSVRATMACRAWGWRTSPPSSSSSAIPIAWLVF